MSSLVGLPSAFALGPLLLLDPVVEASPLGPRSLGEPGLAFVHREAVGRLGGVVEVVEEASAQRPGWCWRAHASLRGSWAWSSSLRLHNPDPLPGADLLQEAFLISSTSDLTSASVATSRLRMPQVDLHDERTCALAEDLVEAVVRIVLGPLERERERFFQRVSGGATASAVVSLPPPLTGGAPCALDRP